MPVMAEVDRPFVVVRSATTVEGWAVVRLDANPTDWQVDYRAALRAAIAELHGSSGSSLACAYVSSADDDYDIENVLFANVGLAAFGNVRVGGVIFERSSHVPLPPPVPLSGPADHYHRYQITSHREPSYWSVGAPVASFATDPVRLPLSASTTWWAIRRGTVRLGRRSTASPLCLRATVTLPVLSPMTLYATMKPLLAGVVAAFHGHDGSGIDDAVARLADRLGEAPAEVRRQLEDDAFDLLGARKVVAAYRDGVIWNPEDARLVAVDLRADVGSEARISGDVFEASTL